MAYHPSAEKRNRQTIKRTLRNRSVRSRMRHAIKAAREAIEHKAQNRTELTKLAIVEINRAKSKKILTANTASRYVSRLMLAANG